MSSYKICKNCGKKIYKPTKYSCKQWINLKYCSKSCSAIKGIELGIRYFYKKGHKVSEKTKNLISKKLKGNNNCGIGINHHRWKGGRLKDKLGYIYIYCPLHPKCNSRGYVLEHRLIMENFLCRFLYKEEVVHHKNSNVKDNRLENLQLFSNNTKHLKWHREHVCN